MARSSFVSPVVALLIAALALASVAAVCGQPDDEGDLQSLGVDEETIAAVTEAATAAVSDMPTAEVTAESATPDANATETPTPQSEATFVPGDAVAPTQIPSELPAASLSDKMWIGGSVWVDARPVTGEVVAFIDGKQCGRGLSVVLPSASRFPTFVMDIASDSEVAGCGLPGSVVTLVVGERTANDTFTWQPGSQPAQTFVVGPAFANYRGTLRTDVKVLDVVPYVGDVACGEAVDLYSGADGLTYYNVAVDPEELKPGCGRAGAEVKFRAEIDGQADVEIAGSTWYTDSLVQRADVDITGSVAVDAPAPTVVAP